MTSALFTLARVLAAGGPVVSIGAPAETVPAGMACVPEDALAGLVAAAVDGPAAFAAAAGIEPAALVGATSVLFPSRGAGWHVDDAAALAAGLRAFLPRTIVAARPASAVQTAGRLERRLADAGARPSLAGLLPVDDPLAPGSPVAIVGDAPGAVAPRTLALVTCSAPDPALAGQVAELVAQGAEVVALDLDAGLDPDTIPGACIERPDPADLAAAVQRIGEERDAGWIVMLDAGQRLSSPWPALSLPEALGRIASLGFDHAAATIVDHAEDGGGWRFPADPASFNRIVGWRRERPAAGAARRSPYNLLLHRRLPDPAPAALATGAWQDAMARGAHLLERLTGHGVFTLANPEPRGLGWAVEERIVSWGGNVLKTGIARLPYPDPMAPRPGVALVRWDTLDGARGSLFGGPEGQPERLLGGGPRGTVALEGMAVNEWRVARLYDDDARGRLLGELRLCFRWDPDA